MHKIAEFFKEHKLPLMIFGGVVVLYLYFRSSGASSTAAPAQNATAVPLCADGTYNCYSGGTVNSSAPASSGGGTGTSVTPTPVTQYTGPVTATSPVTTSTPSTGATAPAANQSTQQAATANPYAINPSAFIAPNVAPNAIAAYNGPNTGQPVISAIQAALSGKVSSTPGGGATSADPALLAALSVGQQPGGLAALPSQNPYLTSPGYTSLQQSILAGPGCCTPDANGNGGPNSPCCQVSIATGEIGTGTPTAASEAYKGGSYCEQNAFNVTEFGYAPDTTNCNGTVPTGSFIAGLIAQFTGPGSATSSNGSTGAPSGPQQAKASPSTSPAYPTLNPTPVSATPSNVQPPAQANSSPSQAPNYPTLSPVPIGNQPISQPFLNMFANIPGTSLVHLLGGTT